MNKILSLVLIIGLAGCGTMGVGRHGPTNVNNNSKNTITVSGNTGTYKIKPMENMQIASTTDMTVVSANPKCHTVNIVREPNTSALLLDIFPGLFLGIVPILVDAISNSLYQMPETFSYSCAE